MAGRNFTYAGPKVGYVIRVSGPRGRETDAVPDLKVVGTDRLVPYLAAPSQVLRLAAQREILRRGDKAAVRKSLESLASADGPLAPRIAAIFTLEQLIGRDSIATLVKLAADSSVREFALKALADRREDAASIPNRPFVDSLADSNPRVRLQAVVALGRLGKVDAAPELLARTTDDDPLVAHVAVKALVALNAVPACLAALGAATPKLAPALRVRSRQCIAQRL